MPKQKCVWAHCQGTNVESGDRGQLAGVPGIKLRSLIIDIYLFQELKIDPCKGLCKYRCIIPSHIVL